MSLPAWIVRRLTYPAHEWLRGRPTLTELRSLQHLGQMTPEGVQRIVGKRLRDLLTFAATRLPFYAQQMVDRQLNVNGRDPQAELRKLPVLQKADVRENADRLTCRGVRGGALPHSSGGTTGDTLRFLIDRRRQAQDLAARLFMQGLFGVRLGERRLHLWGSPIESRGSWYRRRRDWALNERLLNAFELSPAQLDRHLGEIRRFRPSVVYGYPTALALLAQHASGTTRPEDFAWLRLVVLTGEEVTDSQIDVVRSVFGCPVAVEYGSREVGLIAHTCPRGGLHVLWPHIHVEIAASGRTVPEDHCGEVLCTTLNTRAQPFIRYRLGDIGRRVTEPCPCGLPFPLMRLEGGKVTGFIALPDGRLCHGAITSHVLRDLHGIVAYKTYQHALDAFEVLLVVDDGFAPDAVDRVRHRYRSLFGLRTQVDCRVVDDIPPDPSGKRRYVVSDVAPDSSEFELVTLPNT